MSRFYKIAVISNTAWSVWNFRRGLIAALLERGHEVVALAPVDEYVARIEGLGVRFIALQNLAPQGRRIGRDLLFIRELQRVFRHENFDWILSYTIKPNIYAGLAARGLAAGTLPTVNGLGYIFQQQNVLTWLAKRLYRRAFQRASQVVFQNTDDLHFFQSRRLVEPAKCRLARGSGVNLREFQPYSGQTFDGPPVFLFSGRLVAEKGVFEFLQAAEIVKARFPEARFWLAGLPADNPNALSERVLQPFLQKKAVGRIPPTDDVAALLDAVQAVVLPSYYGEGVPRVLLEALAKGLPVITTDHPGCRETVAPGVNGWLVPPRDAGALAGAMLEFCEMSPQLRAAFGRESRLKAVQEFDEQTVIQHYLDAIKA